MAQLVPLLRPLLQPPLRSPLEYRGGFNPAQLFTSGRNGLWLSSRDLSTSYQDSAGTTAGVLTQPAGLVLDKHSGMVRGAEVCSDPSFDDPASWTAGAGITVSGGNAVYSSPAHGTNLVGTGAFEAGKFYVVTVSASSYTSGRITVYLNYSSGVQAGGAKIVTGTGAYQCVIYVTTAGTGFSLQADAASAGACAMTVSDVSIRELPGNHLTQSTSTSRPTLQQPSGYYGWRADGTDDFWTSASGGGGSAGILISASLTVNSGAGTVRTIWDDRGTNTGYALQLNASDQLQLVAGNGSAYTTVATTDTLANGSKHNILVFDDGTNLCARLDSGATASVARPAVSAGSAGFTMFRKNGASSEYAGIDLHEFVYVKDWGGDSPTWVALPRYTGSVAGLSL